MAHSFFYDRERGRGFAEKMEREMWSEIFLFLQR